MLIPAAYLGYLQPMDEDTTVDISTARMKYVGGQRIVQMFEHLQDNPQILVHRFRHTGVFYALGILDKDELPICNSEEDSDNDEDDTDKNEDSDIEEDDASENDDVIQTMRNSLTVSTVYTDGDNDVPVDAIILSSSEDNDKYMYSCM